MSDLFNLKGFEVAGYETNQLRVEALMGALRQNVRPWAVVDSITDVRHPTLDDAESVIVEVSNRKESYWSNTYLWFVLDVFILRRYGAWTEAIRRITQPSKDHSDMHSFNHTSP